MNQTAIVGFGFCGLMTFFHLAQNSYARKIIIFDKEGVNTLGPAFTPFSRHYLLNVPAQKMTAFSDDEMHFCNFIEKNYPQIFSQIGKDGFAPRFIYGEYLQEIKKSVFEIAKKNSVNFELVKGEVSAVNKVNDNFTLQLSDGKTYQASQIILATSLEQQKISADFVAENFIENPWNKNFSYFHQEDFLQKNKIEKIALIGSGLTAVDIILGLKERNFTGEIYVISRRGNFPQKHFSHLKNFPEIINPQDARFGLSFILKKIRKFLRNNPQYDIHDIIDSIRPHIVEFWKNSDAKNKKLFLKFLLPYWNILRHKMPISSAVVIDLLVSLGQLKIVKGGYKKMKFADEKFLIMTKSRDLKVDCIVNCLGFEMNAKKYPLLKQMIGVNLLQQDCLMCNSLDSRIILLGGLNVGRDFESTSIPELRKQVEAVVNYTGSYT